MLTEQLSLYDLSTILGNKIEYGSTVSISTAAYHHFFSGNRVEYVNMLGPKIYFEEFCSFAHFDNEARQI